MFELASIAVGISILVTETKTASAISFGRGGAPIAVSVPLSVQALADKMVLIHELTSCDLGCMFRLLMTGILGDFRLTLRGCGSYVFAEGAYG